MAVVTCKPPKGSSDSPRLTAVKKRPELPRLLFREAILKDKIRSEDATEESAGFRFERISRRQQRDSETNAKEATAGRDLVHASFDVGKKIELRSFALNACRPSRPINNRLFRNQTISGAFSPVPLAGHASTSREVKTCKVQPICIRSNSAVASRDTKDEDSHKDTDDADKQQPQQPQQRPQQQQPQQQQQQQQRRRRRDSTDFSASTKSCKLQRSESDVGPTKLKFFTLRLPRTCNFPDRLFPDKTEIVSSLTAAAAAAAGEGGGTAAAAGSHRGKAGPDNRFPDRSEFSAKPNFILSKQQSIDLPSGEEELAADDAATRATLAVTCDEGLFRRSKTLETSTPSASGGEGQGRVGVRADDSGSKVERCLKSFRVDSKSPQRSSESPSTKCQKVSMKKKKNKTKPANMATSLAMNVPAILSGLKKSLPLQLPPQLAAYSAPPAEKESKKLRSPSSSSSLQQLLLPSTGKGRRKTAEFSLCLQSHPTNDDALNSSSSSSSSSSFSKDGHLSKPEVGEDLPAAGPRRIDRRREDRPSITPSLETCLSNVSEFSSHSNEAEKRDMILKEFLISEKQYVETLRMLVEKYMLPLKTQGVVAEVGCVEEIFYKIQEIYVHHATLIAFLAKSLARWREGSTVGDVIYKNFSKETVVESYVSFVEHFPKAEKALEELMMKSSFQKFIEQCEKETKLKLPLKAQLVKPAQRIPRYELLLKRLLENTPLVHPDYPLLKQAESAIHDLALKINRVDKDGRGEDGHDATLKKLELLLITDLVSPGRHYVRNDQVVVQQQQQQPQQQQQQQHQQQQQQPTTTKEIQCFLWLFTDLVVFSVVKRKNSTINNRKSTLLLRSVSGNDFVENVKHKSWLKIPIGGLHVSHSTLSERMVDRTKAKQQQQLQRQVHGDDDDHHHRRPLNQVAHHAGRLECSHFAMDDAVEDVAMEIGRKLKEIDHCGCGGGISAESDHHLVLHLSTPQEGVQDLRVTLATTEKQMSWEATFLYYKNK